MFCFMSENQKEPQYKLRWSEELRDKIMNSAKEQNRSINAEICARLEQSFEQDQPSNDRAFALAMNMLFSIIKKNKDVAFELPDDIDGYLEELVKATNYKAPR